MNIDNKYRISGMAIDMDSKIINNSFDSCKSCSAVSFGITLLLCLGCTKHSNLLPCYFKIMIKILKVNECFSFYCIFLRAIIQLFLISKIT